MIKMISAVTGVEIWVADNRVDAYIQRGHKVVAPPAEAQPAKPKRKKTVRKKG